MLQAWSWVVSMTYFIASFHGRSSSLRHKINLQTTIPKLPHRVFIINYLFLSVFVLSGGRCAHIKRCGTPYGVHTLFKDGLSNVEFFIILMFIYCIYKSIAYKGKQQLRSWSYCISFHSKVPSFAARLYLTEILAGAKKWHGKLYKWTPLRIRLKHV
jgi:hypothetical protein